jgi:hypothetical protein
VFLASLLIQYHWVKLGGPRGLVMVPDMMVCICMMLRYAFRGRGEMPDPLNFVGRKFVDDQKWEGSLGVRGWYA